MSHTFWRGEHRVLQRDDGTADIYEWQPASGSYAWLGDYTSTDEAEHYVREMEALPEFPEIKPITAKVSAMPYDHWKTTEPEPSIEWDEEEKEEEEEELAPCTDLARRQGCTCSMDPYAYEEVRINRTCPLHGSPAPEYEYEDRTDAAE
jgi:hypothetical protein